MLVRVSCFSLMLLATACTGEDEERNAPPVGSGSASASVGSVGGTSPATTGGDTDTDTRGIGSSSGSSSSAGDSSSSGGTYVVLSGRFNDGRGGYALPITCTVRFHLPGEINPSSGISTATTFTRSFVIDAFPQAFVIDSDEIGDVVTQGDAGYVSSQCDIDGDNFFDDNSGGFFPGLPMTEVTVPASSIDIFIGPI